MDKRLALFVPVAYSTAFFLGIEIGGFQLILLETAKAFNLNNVMMGVLVGSQYMAITLGPLLFGWIADRIGKKTILLFSMPLFALGCFGAALSGTISVLTSSVFFIGIGYSVTESISSSAISDSFPGKEPRYLNFMQCVFCLGAVISPQIFSRLMAASLATWRAVFVFSGSGFVLVYPLLCFSHCKQGTPQNHNTEYPKKETPHIMNPLLFFLVISMLSYVGIETGIAFFAYAIYVTEYSNTTLGAYAISGFWLSMTVSKFIFALTKIKMQNMVLLGFSASCVLFVMLLFFRNQWALMGIFIMFGAVLGPAWPMIIGIGTSSFRERSGTVASLLTASGGFGGAVIPVMIGYISTKAGFYSGFWLLIAVSVIGFFAMWFGKKNIRKTENSA